MRLLISALLLIVWLPIGAHTYFVNKYGAGDFSTISDAIEISQDGDNIVVYPGVYCENIDFSGKNIVITSLYTPEDNNRDIIRRTVIDGGKEDTVVKIVSGETRNAVLSGFTIRNGAYWGKNYKSSSAGGVHIFRDSSPVVQYCVIEHNFSRSGAGGITSLRASPLLRGNIVRYNHGQGVGGIGVSGCDTAEFCNVEPNSIYYNYGDLACDLYVDWIRQDTIIIDTLTVLNPDFYFVGYSGDGVPDNFTIIVRNGKMDPVPADLYVSPEGCDTNSGLSPEEPLQRISTALIRINPPIQGRRTIHLASGIYSSSHSNQLFPIMLRDNVDIIGSDMKSVILDGEDKHAIIIANPIGMPPKEYIQNVNVENLTLSRPLTEEFFLGALHLRDTKNITCDNITVTGCTADYYLYLISTERCDNLLLRNLNIVGNNIQCAGSLISLCYIRKNEKIRVENLRVHNNHLSCMANYVVASNDMSDGGGDVAFVNLEITDNINNITTPSHRLATTFLHVRGKIVVVNATITNNRIIDNYGFLNKNGVVLSKGTTSSRINDVYFYNSILCNNHGDCQIIMSNNLAEPYARQDYLTISHSLIENGIDGVCDFYGGNIIYWEEGNIDADPLFFGENDLGLPPYSLSTSSPVIGAGTLDIPDFEFPEYDLAGNPRIVDGRIDMGAYQWHPYEEPPEPPTEVEESDFVTSRLQEGDFNLRNFPNPATTLLNHSTVGVTGHRSSTTGTNIAFELPESGRVMIEIYNLKGQFVKRIYDAYIPKGEHNVFWDGRNEKGQFVATGFYMYNLHFNEQLVATGKATFIK